ncbi:LysR family transcriptional regulator [Roseibium polysiphoniae]|uniref:LysR family transcriptional regulator n=1 Tax=Roseibium polysiphoniae TaxID=2571221 RepID=A0ABR9C551_9HYPH|nr:LysR family transcriptional regulator [Roseibium polysiphoniae]MBD8874995.1 LysR family transcriptional regulator [Roseibium polysiphoniae]
MDKISTLSSFVAAVDLGSFSAAANSLGISQPAVSQQVRALERQLGARLLNRTTRRLATTEAGERYYIHARDILERLAEADQSVRRFDDEMTGCLSIGAAPGFSEGLLADFFIGFQKRNPKLCLNLSLSDNFQDLIHEGLDVAIRLGDIRDDRLIVKKLGLAERGLAASPEYLDTHGRPQVPEDLVRHRYLLYSQLQTGHDVPLTSTEGERRTVRITPTLRANNSSLLRRAALAGLGIGLAQNWLLDPLVKEGQLEYVLPEWSYAPQPVHAVYPSNRYIPLKVRHFVEEISGFFIEQGAVKNR